MSNIDDYEYEKGLRGFPKQLSRRAARTANANRLRRFRPDGVVVCGMGGSGLIGDVLRETAAEIRLPVPAVTIKNDGLLPVPFKRPLYICISFSGETAETLHCLKDALRKKSAAGVAVVTGRGGTMRRIAEENRLPIALFDPGSLTPRQASGNMYYGLANLLHGAFPQVKVPDLTRKVRPASLARAGAELARKLKGKNTLVYSSAVHPALGYIWKISLNETGKSAAFANTYPEINHNEIVGFAKIKGPWEIVWLADPTASARTRGAAAYVARVLGRRGIGSATVKLKGKSGLERLWNGIVLAEWTSFHLAKLNRVAPAETKVIDGLKRKFK